MIEEKAKVVAINGQQITVESLVKSSCSGCQQVDSCGSGQVAKAIPHRKLKLTLPCQFACQLGDTVIIGIPEDNLLTSAWQVYLLPLIGLMLFGFIGQEFSNQWQLTHEFLTICVSIFGGYLGFRLAKRLQNTLKVAKQLTPQILRKVISTS